MHNTERAFDSRFLIDEEKLFYIVHKTGVKLTEWATFLDLKYILIFKENMYRIITFLF